MNMNTNKTLTHGRIGNAGIAALNAVQGLFRRKDPLYENAPRPDRPDRPLLCEAEKAYALDAALWNAVLRGDVLDARKWLLEGVNHLWTGSYGITTVMLAHLRRERRILDLFIKHEKGELGGKNDAQCAQAPA